MGHLSRLGLLMRALLDQGSRPIGVFRELKYVHHLMPPCEILPAPIGHAPEAVAPTFVYSQILHNCGFHRYEELRTRIRSWHTIFALTKPDLLVCEHSPTALLAAHCLGIPACTFGTGFVTPPDIWPPIPLAHNGPPPLVEQAEDSLRDRLNRILGEFGRPPLSRVTELYGRAADRFLVTFKELDHFAEWRRPGARYCGAWSYFGGLAPEWRVGEGLKLFAYLKPCRLLPSLVNLLSRLSNPLLIYAPEVRSDVLQPLAKPHVAISPQPVGMWRVSRQCDAALLHGTHGATSAMFLARKPCFHMPLYLEQHLLTNKLVRSGAAVAVEQTQEAELESQFTRFLATGHCAHQAALLAEKYRNFDLDREVAATAQQIHQLAV